MLQKFVFCLLLLSLLPGIMLAQSGKIRGVVTDAKSKEPLVGANIVVDQTNFGASTDIDGSFLILNVPVGTYTLKVSYIGFRSATLSNIRVNSQLTTEANLVLSSEDVALQAVEIVAERPLINKSATNAVRIVDAEFFEKLPGRGLDAVITLQPGVVEQNGNIYIRGGRLDETGFTLDGVSIKDIVNGGRSVSITAEAIEQVQVQTGGFTAEYGGASSGIIRSDLKTGSEKWKLSGMMETDDFTAEGKKALGGYSYGYGDITLTAGGPVVLENLRYFGTFQYTKWGDPGTATATVGGVPTPRVWDGFDFRGVRMYGTVTPKHPNTYLSDTMDIISQPGNTSGGRDERTIITGTLSYALADLQLKGSGSYSYNSGNFSTTAANILNTSRLGKYENNDGFLNLKAQYVFDKKTSLEARFNYAFNYQAQYDGAFGPGSSMIPLYGDSAANAARGYTLRADGLDFPAYQIILGDKADGIGELQAFNQAGSQVQGYFKSSIIQIGGRVDLTSQVDKNIEVKVGGEYLHSKYRRFNPASEIQWVLDFKNASLNPSDHSPTGLLANRIRNYGPDNLGYDVFGNEIESNVTDGTSTLDLGPREPVNAAGYIQSKIELSDIVLNLGLRYDYISSDGIDWVNPHSITFANGAIETSNLKTSPAYKYVSPRIGFSFPVTDRTVFHAQYGRFIQQPRLAESYRGIALFYNIITGGFFYQNPAAFGIKPEQTTSYELGFQQQVGEEASFDVTAFYKDIIDQVTYITETSTSEIHGSYYTYTNGDFATTKGLEFKFTLRRTHRIQASLNYTLSDARGTGSTPNALAGAWGAPTGGGVYAPKYIVPLSFNETNRGNFSLDYRFAKNDGGKILERMGLNVLGTFNSGTNFTRIQFNTPDNSTDPRFRYPIEEIGASTTPWVFQLDARLDKSFEVGPVDINVYIYVINLLGADNATSVYPRTGDPKNDGWLGTTEGQKKALTYGRDADLYAQMYNTFNGGLNANNYDVPRQIRFGVKVEY
jgi:outer membrane receptor protein involved in Fe transport